MPFFFLFILRLAFVSSEYFTKYCMSVCVSFSDPGIIDIQRLHLPAVQQNVCSRLLTEAWVGAAAQKAGGDSKGLNLDRLIGE